MKEREGKKEEKEGGRKRGRRGGEQNVLSH
jgi:hypothetical protein